MPMFSPALRRGLVSLVAGLLAVTLVGGCKKKSSSPTAPTPTPPAPVVNTVNPAGSATNRDARTSMKGTVGNGTQTFDDFIASTAATITQVTWQGIYCVENPNQPAPTPTAQSFLVGFYADNNNSPNQNAPLSTGTYQLARVAETADATPNGTCGSATPTGIGVYNYAVTLDTPFNAAAGVRYWVSVMANVNYNFTNSATFVYWGWRSGTANNNRSIQIAPNGAVTEYASDRAYSLIRQ